MRERALAYLEKDTLANIGMIAAIKRGSAVILYAEADGVALQETKSGAYMLATDTAERGRSILDGIASGGLFCLNHADLVPYTAQKYGLRGSMGCVSGLHSGAAIDIPNPQLAFSPLDASFAAVVYQHYHEYAEASYIDARIAAGAMFGGFLDGAFCGFVGTHEEGAVGLLHVLAPFRNRGIAFELEARLINRLLTEGRPVFAQIAPENEPSMRLHRRLGFTLGNQPVYWVFSV